MSSESYNIAAIADEVISGNVIHFPSQKQTPMGNNNNNDGNSAILLLLFVAGHDSRFLISWHRERRY